MSQANLEEEEEYFSDMHVHMCVAVRNGDLEKVKKIINSGKYNVVEHDRDCNLLYMAACNGNLDMVEYLVLTCHASLNPYKESALEGAAYCGHTQIVNWMLEHHDGVVPTNEKFRRRAIGWAGAKKYMDIVRRIQQSLKEDGLE